MGAGRRGAFRDSRDVAHAVAGPGSPRRLGARLRGRYSTLGLLKLRLGALPEADAAARVALRVLQEGDFAPGLGFAATILSDIAVEAGELAEAQALLDLLPQEGWPAGVATVLIPAARGRLRLAQGRAADALADFNTCQALFSADAWGMPIRETGYVHARSGAALALLRLGERHEADKLADAELADVRAFGAPRALGIALRAAGLARGGRDGLALLRESAATLDNSPALLERARSLAELGAALRRVGERTAARDPLARALELAVRLGARPLAAQARDELKAAGARPRRPWRTGTDALTPSELRVARLAAEGRPRRRATIDQSPAKAGSNVLSNLHVASTRPAPATQKTKLLSGEPWDHGTRREVSIHERDGQAGRAVRRRRVAGRSAAMLQRRHTWHHCWRLHPAPLLGPCGADAVRHERKRLRVSAAGPATLRVRIGAPCRLLPDVLGSC